MSEQSPPEDALPENPANFDRLAALYRWMEWLSFGPYLARCRVAFLNDMKSARLALTLGDGDGRFTAALLRENNTVQVDAVDASALMLQALERRIGPDTQRVRTVVADARHWAPRGRGYDVVATHFFLDCLSTDDVRKLAERIRPALADNANWVISEFAVPPGAYGRLVARPLIACLYFAFGFMTGLRIKQLPDHHAALEQAGLVLRERRIWLGGLLTAEKWALPG